MRLPQVHVGFGTQCGPATFFPLWTDAPAMEGIDTGAGAQLSVSELATPEVTRLVVTNQGAKPALLTEGALLEGGQQHRINVRTVLVGAGETRGIDVLCVEQGRWHGTSQHRHTGRRAPLHVQAGLHGSTTRGQYDVWRRVQRYEGVRTRSATGSLIDHLDAPRIEGFRLPNLIEGQRGVIVGFDGQVLALELFGSATMFSRHYATLMESVVLDLTLFGSSPDHGAATPVSAQSARDFIVSMAARGFTAVDQAEHRGSRGTVFSRRLKGQHPNISTRGLSIGGAHLPEPQMAHLSSWNTRHRILASA